MDASLHLMLVFAAVSALVLCGFLRADLVGRRRLARVAEMLEIGVGLFLFLGMLYAGILQVVVRYAPAGVLYASWTEELARLLTVWMTFWGAAMVQRSGAHMTVSVLYDVLPGGAQRVVAIAGEIIVAAILVVLVVQGWRTAALQIGQTMITLDVSIAVFAYAVPVGCTLMLAYVVVGLALRLSTRRASPRGGAGV